ncbi:MAG: HDIG domain-containing protein [Pseudomonadota bacterium]|nr:HDIG domain-containing protein [Pseudomonadota bacterium]
MDENKPNSKDVSDGEGFDLKNLLDSSYPLLKEFRNTCPGTYKHSQALVSMIEGISLTLELDVTTMKIMAQYHDIGKMLNPGYFIENQLDDENPNDNMSPEMSYQIISRHVSDTTMILTKDDNFPKEIIKMMQQHHGTTLVGDFFTKSSSTDENAFRYHSEKPSSLEAMILMICDNIEARSRSGEFDPDDVIDKTIERLTKDGQLDAMKLGDLRQIKDALGKELEGTHHKRVMYATDEKDIED